MKSVPVPNLHLARHLNRVLYGLLFAILIACGGGGGGDRPHDRREVLYESSGTIYFVYDDGSGESTMANFVGENVEPSIRPGVNAFAFSLDRDGDEEIFYKTYTSPEVQLTFNTSPDRDPEWSPDGEWIVFGSSRDGNREIYKMRADGSNQTRLTISPGSNDDDPYFSPDGTKIIFESNRDGDDEIFIMDADGANVVQLTTNTAGDRNPKFAPDGRIVFQSDRTTAGTDKIWIMNSDGSNPLQLTSGTSLDTEPAVSFDGFRIVYVEEPTTATVPSLEFITLDGAGEGSINVVSGASGPSFGRTLAFGG